MAMSVPSPALAVLVDAIVACQQAGLIAPGDPAPLALTAWCTVHGLAALLLNNPPGEQEEAGTQAERMARVVTWQLSQGLLARLKPRQCMVGYPSLQTIFVANGTPAPILELSGIDFSIYPIIALALIIFTAGLGLAMPPATAAVMSSVPVNKAGIGSAMNDTTRQLGAALGVVVLGSIMNSVYLSQIARLRYAPQLAHKRPFKLAWITLFPRPLTYPQRPHPTWWQISTARHTISA